jgi:hypothetical protein
LRGHERSITAVRLDHQPGCTPYVGVVDHTAIRSSNQFALKGHPLVAIEQERIRYCLTPCCDGIKRTISNRPSDRLALLVPISSTDGPSLNLCASSIAPAYAPRQSQATSNTDLGQKRSWSPLSVVATTIH